MACDRSPNEWVLMLELKAEELLDGFVDYRCGQQFTAGGVWVSEWKQAAQLNVSLNEQLSVLWLLAVL